MHVTKKRNRREYLAVNLSPLDQQKRFPFSALSSGNNQPTVVEKLQLKKRHLAMHDAFLPDNDQNLRRQNSTKTKDKLTTRRTAQG